MKNLFFFMFFFNSILLYACNDGKTLYNIEYEQTDNSCDSIKDEVVDIHELLLDIPYQETNPYIRYMYSKVLRGSTSFTNLEKHADEVLAATYMYLHPVSQFKGDALVKERLLFLLTKFFSMEKDSNSRMMFTFQCTLAYYLLSKISPQDIPSELKDNWENVIKEQTEWVFAQKNKQDLYNKLEVGNLWLNGDIRHSMGAYFAGKIFNNSVWCNKAEKVMNQVIPKAILADGGTRYVSYQNESPNYHIPTKRYMLWWYLLTKSEIMKDALRKMSNYAPISNHNIGKGFSEYTSSCSWKPYYNTNVLTFPAAVAAYLFDDSYNFAIGKNDKSWELQFIYRPGLQEKKLPDNHYVIFDRNIIGPRGKFDNWGYVGVARNVQIGDPELSGNDYPAMQDGKSSLAGAYILKKNAKDTEYPLDAAFHSSMPAVKVSRGEETDFNRGNKFIDLVSDEHTELTKGKEIYSLASKYTLSQKRFKTIPWSGMQEWIFTPERIIGLLHIESNSKNKVYGLVNRIKLVGGRKPVSGSGSFKDLIKYDDSTYGFGGLKIKIHSQNYNGEIVSSRFGIWNNPGDDFSCMLTLRDRNDNGDDSEIIYEEGEKRYILVECTYENKNFISDTKVLDLKNGLLGFECVDVNKKLIIIHNPTDIPVLLDYTSATMYPNLFVQKSWDDSMIVKNVLSEITKFDNIEIPSYGHILIINSLDFDSNFNIYEDIFK